MSSSVLKGVMVAGISFILLGIALQFGPDMLTGWEAMRTATGVGNYTGLDTVIGFGPTMIILGFVISVGVGGFLGLKLFKR